MTQTYDTADNEKHYLTQDIINGIIEYESLEDITGLTWIEPTEEGPDIEHAVKITSEEDFLAGLDDGEYVAGIISEKAYAVLKEEYGIH